MEWAAAITLYIIGLIGLHATARDLNHGPIKTRRAWFNLIFWPITVIVGKAGDICDAIRADALKAHIAQCPERQKAGLVKAAQSLVNGIDAGLVRLDSDADEALANIMRDLRAALTSAEETKP